MMEMATRETIKTTPAAADPAIRGSCSLSSDLKSSAHRQTQTGGDHERLGWTLTSMTVWEENRKGGWGVTASKENRDRSECLC